MPSIGEKTTVLKVASSKEMNAAGDFFKKTSYQFMNTQKLTEQHGNG
jgi:hypothetical protein